MGPLRYTQPIFSYLKTLRADGTKHLVDAIDAHTDLPTGPKVVQTTVGSGETMASTVERILQDWKSKGLCRPDEVALIGPRKWLKNSSIGEGKTLCGFEVADYDEDIRGKLTYLGAHRSKGMDFLAVILIDFAPFSDLAADESKQGYQEAYFIGASRARQLLGVVNS